MEHIQRVPKLTSITDTDPQIFAESLKCLSLSEQLYKKMQTVLLLATA